MIQKTFVRDLEKCKALWDAFIHPKHISDLWEFRLCFHHHFNCRPCFLVLEDRKGVAAVLPLSYIDDLEMFVFFPGETWKAKTWLERTPIYLREDEFLPELYLSCPDRTFLRYMEISEDHLFPDLHVDEIGYSLYPADLDFDITLYRKRFPNKKYKNIIKTIKSLTDTACSFHLNRLQDFDFIVKTSIRRFGRDSYLCDPRLRESFRDIMHFLHRKGWLRMVSLEINGRIVAVDIGALYRGTYTVFLGGADLELPGIAKAINMYHIDFAFKKRLSKVDFLCGDFHWKKLWHLDPEPLYKFLTPALRTEHEAEHEPASAATISSAEVSDALNLTAEGEIFHVV